MSNYWKLSNTEKRAYHDFCTETFGVASFHKNRKGNLTFIDPKFIVNERMAEPIYHGVTFEDIFKRFKQHYRELRLEKILS